MDIIDHIMTFLYGVYYVIMMLIILPLRGIEIVSGYLADTLEEYL